MTTSIINKMNTEIKYFIEKLDQIQCRESIEFRLRFKKKWLLFQNNDNEKGKELVQLIEEYHKFLNLRNK